MKKILITLLLFSLCCGCTSSLKETSSQQTQACHKIDYYDYSQVVPVQEKIEDSYFEDTLFIGDSRMGSLALFSDLPSLGAEIDYVESMSLWTMENSKVDTSLGTKSIYDILMNTTKKNVYILVGINEIRRDDFDDWASYLEEDIVQPFLENHTDTNIYLMLNYIPFGVSDISEEDLKEHIQKQNEKMIDIAQRNRLYLLDVSSDMVDENGTIKKELVWDGLHFNLDGAKAYANTIQTHVVRKDAYVSEICE